MAEKAKKAIPEGMHTLTPSFWFNGDCKKALEFYKKAFGATLMGPPAMDEKKGTVLHAMMKIGDSPTMMADSYGSEPECGPKGHTTVGMWLYVEDCDVWFDRAVKAGCKVLMPMMDCFWGDRMGKLVDPFGHTWAIASHKYTFTEEEMKKGQMEWEKSMEGHHHEGCC